MIEMEPCGVLFEKSPSQVIPATPISRMLFENRQPRITYFLCLQDPFSLDINVKSNLDSLWIFGGFDKQRFGMLFRQLNNCFDESEYNHGLTFIFIYHLFQVHQCNPVVDVVQLLVNRL